MRALATIAKLPEVDYTTIYGTSRSSPRSFYGHPRCRAASAAIVFAESAVIRATACTLADEPADGPARPRPARRISAPRAEHGT